MTPARPDRLYKLKIVREQTEDICLYAVTQDGKWLRDVKKQTKKICIAAVQQSLIAFKYVDEPSEEILIEALKQNNNLSEHMAEQDVRLYLNTAMEILFNYTNKQNSSGIEYIKNRLVKCI